MEKHIRTLTILLYSEISEREVQMFRGAVLGVIGTDDNALCSGHEQDGACRQRYPLIQYKSLGGRAAIVCIGQGIDAILPFLESNSETLRLGHREVQAGVLEVSQSDTVVQLTATPVSYRLHAWLAFNPENDRRYEQARGLRQRAEILEAVLCGNILSMLKGLDCYIDGKLEVCITDVKERRPDYVKGFPMRSFDAAFTANILLPQYLGLGKSASKGHGIVTRIQ